jgi:hypothetical protein
MELGVQRHRLLGARGCNPVGAWRHRGERLFVGAECRPARLGRLVQHARLAGEPSMRSETIKGKPIRVTGSVSLAVALPGVVVGKRTGRTLPPAARGGYVVRDGKWPLAYVYSRDDAAETERKC